MSTKINAAGGVIRQVVSYLTLSNVSLDSSKNSVNIDDFKLYDSNGHIVRQLSPTTMAAQNETEFGLDGYPRDWTTEFMALWLSLLLLVPVLVLVMCYCLSRSDKDESQLASLMEKDWEAGGQRAATSATAAKAGAPD